MKVKLQEFAQLAEIASAIAIVASLIFVGLQIQQSNRLSEWQAYEARAYSIAEQSRSSALSPVMAETVVKYRNHGIDSLSDTELYRMERWQNGNMRSMQASYYSFQQGYLDSVAKDALIQDVILRSYQLWSELGMLERIEIPEMREEIERAFLEAGNP